MLLSALQRLAAKVHGNKATRFYKKQSPFSTLLILLLLCCYPGAAFAQPENDNFTSATVLSSPSGTVTGSNVGATAEPGEPSHWGPASQSVWWRYTAESSGTLTINTNGSSFDTVLAVYTGSSVNAISKIVSSDDGGTGSASAVTFNVAAGTDYYIAVDGYGSVSGSVTLNYYETPALLAISTSSLSTSSTAGTNPPAQSFEIWNSGSSTAISYSITDNVSWLIVSPTSGSSAGSRQTHTVSYYSSGLSVGTYKGTITISSPGAATKTLPVTLTVSPAPPPVNDDFTSATVLSGSSGTVSGISLGATAEAGEPSHYGIARKSVWWRYTAVSSGTLSINTNGSNFDTVLAVYTGSTLSELTKIASNDDSGIGSASLLTISVTAGTTYYIAVDGFSGGSGIISLNYTETLPLLSISQSSLSATCTAGTDASSQSFEVWNSGNSNSISYSISDNSSWLSVSPASGSSTGTRQAHTVYYYTSGLSAGTYNWTITITSPDAVTRTLPVRLTVLPIPPPANDNFTSATALSGLFGDVSGTNVGATAETDEPSHWGTARKSVWWKYTTESSGSLTINTNGSNIDTVLAVYTGSSVNALTRIAYNNDGGIGTASSVFFTVTAGTTYYIAVDGNNGASGSISLNHSEMLPLLSVSPSNLSTTCTAGTNAPSQSFEVWNSGDSNPISYSITDNVSWLSVSPLSGSSAGSRQSHTVSYNSAGLSAGTYNGTITISSSSAASRVVSVSLTVVPLPPPANDDFTSASVLSGLSGTVSGTNVGATAETGEPSHFGYARKSVWWKYTAESSGSLTINTNGSTFDTVLAVYTGSTLNALTKIASNDDGGVGTASSVSFMVTAGTTYYIAVDGYSGVSGTISLNYSEILPLLSIAPSTLSITCTAGTNAPDEIVEVWNSGNSDSISYSITDNSSWLSVSPTSGSSAGSRQTHTLSFNNSGLSAGTYDFTITVSSLNSAFRTLPVTLTVLPAPPPVNDNFTSATVLSGLSGSDSCNNASATAETGEPSHYGYARKSVWWKYTAESSGSLTINTNGSTLDTVLAVYTGSTLDSLTKITYNDNSGIGLASLVTISVTAGTTYYIAVDGYNGAIGTISLNYTEILPLLSVSHSTLSTTCTADVSPQSQSFEVWNSGNSNSISYSITDNAYWLSVSPTSGTSDGSRQVHTVSFSSGLSAGTYNGTITISSPDAATRTVAVRLVVLPALPPVNDNFTSATVLVGLSGNDSCSNLAATAEVWEPQHFGSARKSAWWKYTAEGSGSLTINTIGSTFNTVLAVYTGSTLNALSKIASNNDSGSGYASLVTISVTAGTTYYIAVDGYNGASGTISLNHTEVLPLLSISHSSLSTTCTVGTNAPSQSFEVWNSGNSNSISYSITDSSSMLSVSPTSGSSDGSRQMHTVSFNSSGLAARTYNFTITVSSPDALTRTLPVTLTVLPPPPPVNDNFASATVLSGMSGTVSGTNVEATAEPGEPAHWGSARKSAWWKYTAESSGTLTINTNGSTYDTVLAVYTGESIGALTKIASNNNSGTGSESLVRIDVTPGTVYYIAVDGYNGVSGTISLNYSELLPLLSISPSTLYTTCTAGTNAPSQSFEVWNSGNSNSISYSITDNSSWISVSPTSGSSAGSRQAHTLFFNTSGAATGTYNLTITVSSPDAATRTLPVTLTVLAASPPVNDNFANATALSGLSGTVTGTNVAATAETGEPSHYGYARKSVWWKLTAESNGTLFINTTGSNFDTVLGVYTGSSISALTKIVSNDDGGFGSSSSVSFSVTAGTTYYIAVDGYGGANGSIALNYGPTEIAPEISLTPSSLYPSCASGTNPPDQSFELRNSGNSTPISYYITTSVSWLTLNVVSGSLSTVPSTHSVSYDSSGLPVGTYHGSIIIRSASAPTKILSVTLTVGATTAADKTWMLYE